MAWLLGLVSVFAGALLLVGWALDRFYPVRDPLPDLPLVEWPEPGEGE